MSSWPFINTFECPILGSLIYSCPVCHLILHKTCRELPRKIHSPVHTKHTLVLNHCSDFRCKTCREDSKGFAFFCGECSYTVGITCALLPTTIRHDAHYKHLLNFVDVPLDTEQRCTACRKFWQTFMFKRINCNFILHIRCALLHKQYHRFCKHGLTLQYSAVRIKSEEYYCEICEIKVNPQIWFYYCVDCNYVFHSKCITR